MDSLAAELREREKELDAIYALAALLGKPGLRLEEALAGTVELFRQALERPEAARVSLSAGKVAVAFPDRGTAEAPTRSSAPAEEAPATNRLRAMAEGGIPVIVEAEYPAGSGLEFREREGLLARSIASLLADAATRIEQTELLERRAAEVERKNAALSELLERIEAEKARSKEGLAESIRGSLSPLIARLRGADAAEGAEIGRSLESALGAVLRGLPDPTAALSPREAEVGRLAASGLTSKEIAARLGISPATVERHRYNLRRKLGGAGSPRRIDELLSPESASETGSA